jgi:uncharacterized membrane protein YidH (DUF202 family)
LASQNVSLKIVGSLAFLAGTFALSYGFAETFLVPGTPGETFFQRDRVLFGLLPLAIAISILCLAGWFFARASSNPKRRLSDTITCCIGGAVITVFACFILAALWQKGKG